MKYYQYFETKNRPSGEEFTCLKDEAPIELKDFIFNIHHDHFFGCLPNDWIYSMVFAAFYDLEDYDIEEITIEADVYTYDLVKWLADNCNAFALEYCNEWHEEFQSSGEGNIISQIQGGLWFAKDRIYRAVSEFMKENAHHDNK